MPDCMYDYRYEYPKQIEVDRCYDCGESIYTGDEYYEILGKAFCKECIEGFKREAEE